MVVVVVVLAGVYQSSSETGAVFVVVVAGDGADADKTVQLASVSVALAGRSLVSGGAQLQVGGFGDVEPVQAAELEQAGVRRGVVLILSAFRRPLAPLSCSIVTDEPFSPGQRLLILRGTPVTVSSRDLPRPMPGRRGDSWSSVFCSGRVSGGDGCRSLLGGVPAFQLNSGWWSAVLGGRRAGAGCVVFVCSLALVGNNESNKTNSYSGENIPSML